VLDQDVVLQYRDLGRSSLCLMIILRDHGFPPARNSASLSTGVRRRPASRPSRRRCRLASMRVDPSMPTTSVLAARGSRTRSTVSVGRRELCWPPHRVGGVADAVVASPHRWSQRRRPVLIRPLQAALTR
jgi:hypothetical protein